MHHERNIRRPGVIALGVALIASVTACGDDADDPYCDAWAGLVESYEELRSVDLAADGLDGLRAGIDGVAASLDELASAADEQLGDQVAGLRTSVEELLETVVSTDLPVDRREEVRAALDDVRAAWDDVVAQAGVECPGVDVDGG